MLNQVVALLGQPNVIRVDKAQEFFADRFAAWCTEQGIAVWNIQSSKPNLDGFVERLNRTLHGEVVHAYLFKPLEQVPKISVQLKQENNEGRPHDTLGRMPPSLFSIRQTA